MELPRFTLMSVLHRKINTRICHYEFPSIHVSFIKSPVVENTFNHQRKQLSNFPFKINVETGKVKTFIDSCL